jgi:hypothetical protein
MKTPAHSRDATSHPALDQSADLVKDGAARPARQSAERALPAFTAASPRVTAQAQLAGQLARSPRMVAQRQALRDSLGAAVQLRGPEEEELQMKQEVRSAPPKKVENNTGLPDTLKSGIESLSGMSMDDVNVHYNSSRPAQLNALAYAQGRDIHVAPGQERHLPHEAWHVVQQKQGRVKPTTQVASVVINDDERLEREADSMEHELAHVTQQREGRVHSPMGAGVSMEDAKSRAEVDRTAWRAATVQISSTQPPFLGLPTQKIGRTSSVNQPVQRAVPTVYRAAKPIPETGTYQARGGKDTLFDKTEYPRSKFSFGTNTLDEVFLRYPHQSETESLLYVHRMDSL